MLCVKPLIRLDSKTQQRQHESKQFISYKHYKYKKNINWLQKKGEITIFPCRSCLPCLNMSRYHWVKKLELEKKLWLNTYFITLTYNDENLPIDNNLNVKHCQNFIKYLRRQFEKTNDSLRYFLAGEYGSKTKRPHYHLILFTNKYLDLKYLKHTKNGILFDCDLISKCWLNKGYVWVAFDNNSQSFSYVASYSNKSKLKRVQNQENKQRQDFIKELYQDTNLSGFMKYVIFDMTYKPSFKPEFIISSKKPPLGSQCETTYKNNPSSLIKWKLKQEIDLNKDNPDYNVLNSELMKELDKRKKEYFSFCDNNDLFDLIENNKVMLQKRLRQKENKNKN